MTHSVLSRLLLTGLVLTGSSTSLLAMDRADSAPDAETVVTRMIEAHGGYETWAAAPSVRYDNVFFNPFALQQEGQNPWWVAHEIIEQGSRRVVQEWPTEGGRMAWDGHEVWSENWPIPNPPKFMAHFFYYFVNLPWITQDEGVVLGDVGTGRLPGHDKDFLTIPIEEAPTIGKTALDSFVLYIDPDTWILQGYAYSIGYGALLDMMRIPKGQIMGPILRVHDRFVRADGLLVPTRFHTMSMDGSATYGHHVILNPSFSQPFPEEKLAKPKGAIVDTTSAARTAG